MNGLRSAIGFLTILPLAPRDAPSSMSSARGWFPFVGLLLGIILAAVESLTVLLLGGNWGWASLESMESAVFYSEPSPMVMLWAVMTVVLLAALTRALHLDGFMDSCDALFGGFDRERRLAILRDPHVGAFAVIGVVCLLMAKAAAIAALPQVGPIPPVSLDRPDKLPMLLLFPCLSRWAMLLTMELYPYARRNGLGTAFFHESKDASGSDSGANSDGKRRIRWHLILGFGFTLVVSVALAGVTGLMMLAAACAVAWGVGAWATRLLGGVTGDIYGAVNEIAEVAVLLLALILIAAAPISIYSPLFELLWSVLP